MAIKVFIDQGHNPQGVNAGAEGNGYREQDITYAVGQALYRLLSADDAFEAELSRPTPETSLGTSNASSLRTRVELAESFGADLFLSIHTNASENPNASGSEALVYARDTTSYRIAEVLLEALTAATGFRNRGVILRPGLYVLRRTSMPAVLMEIGWITNPAEAALMVSSPELFAEGLYQGLKNYYGV